jgi:hypothetical protein
MNYQSMLAALGGGGMPQGGAGAGNTEVRIPEICRNATPLCPCTIRTIDLGRNARALL